MPEGVLDSSAVLAMLQDEPGGDTIERILDDCLISVVNEAEIIAKLLRSRWSTLDVRELVLSLSYRLVDMDRDLARRAGFLAGITLSRGLSLGDRCCLALAEREGLPAFTNDTGWRDLPLDIDIRLIRPKPGS